MADEDNQIHGDELSSTASQAKVTARSSKRKSRSRKSTSDISNPLKALLNKEQQVEADRIKKFFNTQTTQFTDNGQLGYKVKDTISIEGTTYYPGDLVPVDKVTTWSKSNELGTPRAEKNPDEDTFKDGGDPDDDTSDTYPSPLKDNNAYRFNRM